MISLILLIGIIYWVSVDYGNDAAAVAVLIAMAGIIILGFKACGDISSAYCNWIDHWKNKRYEVPRQTNEIRREMRLQESQWKDTGESAAQAAKRIEERLKRLEDRVSEEHKAPPAVYSNVGMQTGAMEQLFMTDNRRLKVEVFQCPQCHNYIRTQSGLICRDGKVQRECACPICDVKITFGRP